MTTDIKQFYYFIIVYGIMNSEISERNNILEKSATLLGYCEKTICLPFEEKAYSQILLDGKAFRSHLDHLIQKHPELFPSDIHGGYQLHDFSRPSKKMDGFQMRRIKLTSTQQTYLIRPSFVMPYLTAETDTIEKALFLLQFNVPYWALTYVFGHHDMFWFRMAIAFGRHNLVGTTIKSAERIPQNLLADEKHTFINGQRAYIATTVGDDLMLGASITLQADTEHLTEAYGHFKAEATTVNPTYQPKTVNTDGWLSTGYSWKSLFSGIVVILCFLHAFLKIRNCAKQLKTDFFNISQKVWEAYRQPTVDAFMTKINELKVWTIKQIQHTTAKAAILKLCSNAPIYCLSYQFPEAHRTSNMIDRTLNAMDRFLYDTQYFHGHINTAECRVRSWAILHNFWPYNPKTQKIKKSQSPFQNVNHFAYHENWLHNLLIACSMAGTPG